jgi:hypothetical protein
MIGLATRAVEATIVGSVVFKDGPKDLLASLEALDTVAATGRCEPRHVSLAMYAAVSNCGKARRAYPPERRVFSFKPPARD